MSDIFREIDEELRRDNLLKLWQRYGRYVIAAGAVVLLIAALFVGWRDHQRTLRQEQSARYAAALTMVRDGKDGEAAKLFASIAAERGGYAVLASFEQAAALAKSGDRKRVAEIYNRIAHSDNVGKVFQDLALLLGAEQEFATADPHAIIDRLQPLTKAGNAFRPSAIELTALARLKAGDKTAAVGLYKQLADDPATPQGLRARAAEMTAALGS